MREIMKKQLQRNLLTGVFLAFFAEGVIALGATSFAEITVRNLSFWRLCVFLAIAVGSCFLSERTGIAISDMLFRYRYVLALALLIVLVALDINGSAIDVWKNYLPNGKNDGLLWHFAQNGRSDEWAAYTPLTFSSFLNHSGAFAYFNTTARGTLTDSFIVYGQPVKDIAILFRPFQIGYLFLGMSRGLSFYWWSRLFALFFSSLELGLILTGKNRRLSVFFAISMAFAPVVQWWSSINSLVEMLAAGNCFILMVHSWIAHCSIWRRSLYAVVMGICGGCFVLAFYPAWMIPLGYFYLALLIWVIYENRKSIHVTWADLIPLACFFLVFGGGLLHVFFKSRETIDLIFNSAYPGKRESFGGGFGKMLYNYVLAPYLGISQSGFEGAGCEWAGFLDFRPAGFLLAVYVLVREKKKDVLLCVLIFFELLLDIYVAWGFPDFLAKITLLSWSTPNRAAQMAGLFQILMLVRAMSQMKENCGKVTAGILSAVCVAIAMYYSIGMQKEYWRISMILITCIVSFAVFFCLFQSGRESFFRAGIWLWGLMCIFSGALVNPIQQGIDVIYENELVQEIQRIAEADPQARWLVDDAGYPMTNVPIMAGAPTVNSTSVYPNLELWGSLDPEGEKEDTYNRYAHIRANLTQAEKTEFKLIQADVFEVNLSLEDAKKIEIRYVLTDRKLEQELSSDTVEYHRIYQSGIYYIYQLTYE